MRIWERGNLRRHQSGLLDPSWPSALDRSPSPEACTEGAGWSEDVQSGHGISVIVDAAGWTSVEGRTVLVAAVQMAGPQRIVAIDGARRWMPYKAVGFVATQVLARPRLCFHTWTLEVVMAESRRLEGSRT